MIRWSRDGGLRVGGGTASVHSGRGRRGISHRHCCRLAVGLGWPLLGLLLKFAYLKLDVGIVGRFT